MATLLIRIIDSKFVSHNGVNLKTFEEHHVSGNGWEATLSEDGKLECVALRYYEGVLHLVKFKIQKGYVRQILKIGDKRARVLRSFKIKKWPAEVVLGLPGGYIDSRRPYIRTEEFQGFLDKYNISSVQNENANGIYQLIREVKNGEVVYEETIKTDGNVKLIKTDDENGFYRYEVTDASWVIKTIEKDGNKIKVLYTTDNPILIKNLPEI